MTNPPVVLGFGEYTPDAPEIALGGSPDGMQVLDNVLPLTVESYGPMSDVAVYSTTAINARCQGAFSVFGTDGSVNIFAASGDIIHRLVGTDLQAAGGPYGTPEEGQWAFANYGDQVFATNLADPIQLFTLGSSSFFGDLSVAAPHARHICVSNNFLIAGNLTHPDIGTVPHAIWWSAVGDPTDWPILASPDAAAKESDYRLLTIGGVTGLVPNIAGGTMIIGRSGVARMTYVGSPLVFQIDAMDTFRGSEAPGSICQSGGQMFWLADNGFCSYSGGYAPVAIGEGKVDKTFFRELDQDSMHMISSAVDPINHIVFWSSKRSSSDKTTRYWAYHYGLNRWATGDMAVEWLFRAMTTGMTLEQIGDIFPILEDVPFSLDSRVWQGGKITLAGINGDGQLVMFSGASKAATLQTEDAHLNGRIFNINSMRPLSDSSSIMAQVATRFGQSEPITLAPFLGFNNDGTAPVRASARYARAHITIPADTSWSYCQGVEVDMSQDGWR